jgi:hypothetical protein
LCVCVCFCVCVCVCVGGWVVGLGLRNGSVWVGDGATSIPDPRIPSGMGLDPSPSIYRRKICDRDGTSPIPDKVLGSVYHPSDLIGDGANPIPIPYWRPVIERGWVQHHPQWRTGVGDASSRIPDPYRPIFVPQTRARARVGKRPFYLLQNDFHNSLFDCPPSLKWFELHSTALTMSPSTVSLPTKAENSN